MKYNNVAINGLSKNIKNEYITYDQLKERYIKYRHEKDKEDIKSLAFLLLPLCFSLGGDYLIRHYIGYQGFLLITLGVIITIVGCFSVFMIGIICIDNLELNDEVKIEAVISDQELLCNFKIIELELDDKKIDKQIQLIVADKTDVISKIKLNRYKYELASKINIINPLIDIQKKIIYLPYTEVI